MNTDESKTRAELLNELKELRQRLVQAEAETFNMSEENFHNLFDNCPLGIRIVSKEGESLYANQAILDIYGYTCFEELKTIPRKKSYTPESYVEHQLRKEKRQCGEYVPSHYEISVVSKNGEIRRLEVFRKEILWNHQSQFQVLYQDITGRKKTEDKLLKSEQINRLLADFHKRLNIISLTFGEAVDTSDLCKKIAESFRFLTGAIASSFAVYDQEARVLKVLSLSIDPISRDKIGRAHV
jgi:PAS domain S-box-containing protein